jgi:hypothetical protein
MHFAVSGEVSSASSLSGTWQESHVTKPIRYSLVYEILRLRPTVRAQRQLNTLCGSTMRIGVHGRMRVPERLSYLERSPNSGTLRKLRGVLHHLEGMKVGLPITQQQPSSTSYHPPPV